MKVRLNYSYKRFGAKFSEIPDGPAQNLRHGFAVLVGCVARRGALMVFIDEFIVNSRTAKAYTWAKRGTSPSVHIGKRQESIKCCLAVSQHLVHSIQTQSKNFGAKDFLSFLDNNLSNWTRFSNSLGLPLVLIMDNAPYHRAKTVRKYMEDNGIRALTTPPYSPDTNMAEIFINNVKSRVKAKRAMGR